MKKVLSFDFGASSGRAMLAELKNGKIEMTEIHRFSNDPVNINGRMYWDILRLFFEIKTGITKAVNSGGFDAIGIDTWGVDFGLINKRGELITNPIHAVFKAAHPSPLSAYNGFFGCRHFSKVNDFLISNNIQPIDWTISNK